MSARRIVATKATQTAFTELDIARALSWAAACYSGTARETWVIRDAKTRSHYLGLARLYARDRAGLFPEKS